MKKPWWKTQYLDPVITEVMFAWRTDTVAEVDRVLRELKLPKGARILDLACGKGRHSIELAKRGFRVTGLDYSPFLLSHARRESRRLPRSSRPEFVEGDMRQLKRCFGPGSFDAVVNLWNAWGYFDLRSDDRRVMQGISHVLVPGGCAVINTLNEGGVIERLKTQKQRWNEESRGRFFLQQFTFDKPRKRLHAQWILIDPRRDGIRRYAFAQNVYSTRDFREELGRVGMRMTKLWGILAGEKYSRKSWHQTFVARKARRGS